ncbi:Protein D2 isoform X1 [Aphelenchoides besseyi]|nr:Protein D2 isoform X1 [Aphelenchoides besseyi]KAI6209163.1 Protein D2 isoform X1 [Aphelenchoides besseyi]
MNSIVLFLFLFAVYSSAQRWYDRETIRFWYDYHDVTPDVFKVAPQNYAMVRYERRDVNLGNVMSMRLIKNQPRVYWQGSGRNYYTLALIDPDAPSRKDPTFGQFRHWLVINIRGKNVRKGQVISKYIAPAPPEKTRWHRYVFSIFKQNGRIKSLEENEDNRPKWNISEFASRNGLKLVAGAYFVTRNPKQ